MAKYDPTFGMLRYKMKINALCGLLLQGTSLYCITDDLKHGRRSAAKPGEINRSGGSQPARSVFWRVTITEAPH